ncbi:YegS/Rv2252/BmrU family lipid kinase [Laspinema olomoucense]|uniref:YegS/Rv2252/BmrU family lipid kinase n=1 Tax=Laspinema olomoucense TaxID=3231600 RepID=UPI0021BB19CD|nr:YegS/Rv2252/BmrU family lipid kinase [Laspinema sp. D3a]MCT7989200.1 YegS/Rv2252/BmrU family lipid kinase [Laspinema sp. D3a]
MSTRSACLIFNPCSGNGNPEAELKQIFALLEPEITLDIRYTKADLETSQLAHEAIARGVDLVIASGGDGTVSAVAEALVNTEIPLGVIPRGTANAFASALSIPTNIPGACETILNGLIRAIDAATCNGKPCILLAGIGWEAETVEQADREAKNWFGVMAYLVAGIEKLWEIQSFEVELEMDGEISRLRAIAVTVANAAPATSVLAQGPGGVIPDDGLLDVTILSTQTEMSTLGAVSSLMTGALRGVASQHNDVLYLRTNRIKVTTNPPQKVTVDGEITGTTPVEIECIPLGLKVMVPEI